MGNPAVTFTFPQSVFKRQNLDNRKGLSPTYHFDCLARGKNHGGQTLPFKTENFLTNAKNENRPQYASDLKSANAGHGLGKPETFASVTFMEANQKRHG